MGGECHSSAAASAAAATTTILALGNTATSSSTTAPTIAAKPATAPSAFAEPIDIVPREAGFLLDADLIKRLHFWWSAFDVNARAATTPTAPATAAATLFFIPIAAQSITVLWSEGFVSSFFSVSSESEFQLLLFLCNDLSRKDKQRLARLAAATFFSRTDRFWHRDIPFPLCLQS